MQSCSIATEAGLDELRYAVGAADVAEPVFERGAHIGGELRLELEPDGEARHAEAGVIAVDAFERPRAWESEVEGAYHGLVVGRALALLLGLVVGADRLEQTAALVGQVAHVRVHVVYEIGRGLLALERQARQPDDVEAVQYDVLRGGGLAGAGSGRAAGVTRLHGEARLLSARLLEELLLYDAEDL